MKLIEDEDFIRELHEKRYKTYFDHCDIHINPVDGTDEIKPEYILDLVMKELDMVIMNWYN